MNKSENIINIAGLEIRVLIDKKLDGVEEFIANFKDVTAAESSQTTTIHICEDRERKIELSDDWNTLYIKGNDINDLSDPFTLIGLTQAIFRFAAIHLSKKGVLLLHGSTAKLDDNLVCFGDDGSSTAKTLSSVEIGLKSKEYVADEFCFLDTATSRIIGYPIIPIHLRPDVLRHLETEHDINFSPSLYKNSIAGHFLNQNELFESVSGDLDVLAYTYFSTTNSRILKLDTSESVKSFKFCVTTHIAKLLHPELDRMQFASMSDSSELKEIDEKIVNDICDKLPINQCASDFIEKIESYKLSVITPCEISQLLKTEL